MNENLEPIAQRKKKQHFFLFFFFLSKAICELGMEEVGLQEITDKTMAWARAGMPGGTHFPSFSNAHKVQLQFLDILGVI